MKTDEVTAALGVVAEAKAEWTKARAKFDSDVALVMARLLNEAALNMMTAQQISKASGLTVKRVRQLMRDHGLNPKVGRRELAKHAAEALQENSSLLGIEPHEMDLMSPLAYLPMGSEMRKRIAAQADEPEGDDL